MFKGLAAQRLVALFFAAAALFNFPLLALWDHDARVWFLPIYLGPMLAMLLAWMVVRKMIRIAKTYRITTIADLIASRYGKSPLLAGLVTLITVVGIVPYIALQLKASQRVCGTHLAAGHACGAKR